MAIAYVNGNGAMNNELATSLAAGSFDATTGNTIFVLSSTYNGSAVSSVTDTASNSYSICGSVEGLDVNHKFEIWVSTNITGNASNIVTVNYGGSSPYRKILATQFSGLATSSIYDTGSTLLLTPSSTSHTSNTTSTTSQDSELILCGCLTGDQVSGVSATDPYYIGNVYTTGNLSSIFFAYRIVSSIGTYSITFSTQSTSCQVTTMVRTFKGLVEATGQPSSKRLGGIPFASQNSQSSYRW